MRKWIDLFEETIDHWTDHMIDAVSAAEAGFHFEEGGCWGMALALYDAFKADGINPEIVVMDGYAHAFVRVNGHLYDHQGMSSYDGPVTQISPEQVYELGHGVTRSEIDSDKAAAAEIIEAARDR